MGIIIPNMGKIEHGKSGLASALFAKVQLRVLTLLIGQPERQYHASEIIKIVQSGSGAVQRELEKLTRAGIDVVTPSGNRKMYQANRDSPIFHDLRGLIMKTAGLVEPIQTALKKFRAEIRFAFVYGSIAKGLDTAGSDIDLLIVGDELSYGPIFNALQKAEQILQRPVSPNLMITSDWARKVEDRSPFVTKIMQQPKIFVYGDENELQRT